jgi:ABC-type transporter Mla subunit MlaD
MALQDLTPQLRTRLSRMERAVGWFVFLATALLLFGFGYYVYHTAERKGWFLVKAKFFTYVHNASGLNVGDPVVLIGFQVGQITSIAAMPPRDANAVRVEFEINQVNQSKVPYYSYIWSEGSKVKVNASDFLGKRGLEITRGTGGFGIYSTHPLEKLSIEQAENLSDPDEWRLAENVFDENSNLVLRAFTLLTKSNATQIAVLKHEPVFAFHIPVRHHFISAAWNDQLQRYQDYSSETNDPYYLRAAESPAVTDQLQAMIGQVQAALPNFLALTNKINAVLDNTANATSNLNVTLVTVHPMLTNFADISAQLREPGGVAVWALGTNGDDQILGSLTNLDALLNHLADITGNLNAQVQSNTNLVGGIYKTIGDTDDFIQGLKRHWLLRSAFKVKSTNAPAKK